MIRSKDKADLNQMVREYGLQAIISQAADSDETCAEMFQHRLEKESISFVMESFISACEKHWWQLAERATTFNERTEVEDVKKLLEALRASLRAL